MKKLFFAVMAVCAMIFVAGTVMAFDAPSGALYGVTSNGTYFISADVVKAVNGSAPKLLAASTSFKPAAMQLDGNYYVYASGKQLRAGAKTDFCFDVGNNQYIPHALVNDARIKAGDAVDNGVGGFNFRMAPR